MAHALKRLVIYIFFRLLLIVFLYLSANNQAFDEVEWKLESIVKGEAGQVSHFVSEKKNNKRMHYIPGQERKWVVTVTNIAAKNPISIISYKNHSNYHCVVQKDIFQGK